MKTKKYTIRREAQVGKTRVLYEGPARKLEQLKDYFSDQKTSDVYPALEKGYESAIFIYATDATFMSRLQKFCKDNLSGPAGGSFVTGLPPSILKTGQILFYLFLMSTVIYIMWELLMFAIQIFYLRL